MTARKADAAAVRSSLERLVHIGGAEALQAALPTNSKRMVKEGLLPRHAIGPEPWVLTIEGQRVALTWPDGHTFPPRHPVRPHRRRTRTQPRRRSLSGSAPLT